MQIDPTVPVPQQIADRLRARITTGELRPGDRLPGERAYAEQLGVPRYSVAAAYQRLAALGLARTRRGTPQHGWTVTVPRAPRVIDGARYAAEAQRLAAGDTEAWTHYTRDNGATWDDYRVQSFRDVGAPTDTEATQLAIEMSDRVIRRSMVEYLRGEPTQLRVSVVPHGPRTEPLLHQSARRVGGAMAELWDLGIRADECRHQITTRIATDMEATQLELHSGVPVTDIARTFFAAGDPVEYSVITMPAIGTVLEWTDTWGWPA